MDIHRYLWSSIDIHWYLWNSLDIHRYLWIDIYDSTDIHRYQLNSIDIRRYLWNSADIHRYNSIDTHRYLWNSWDFHWYLWIDTYGILQISIDIIDIRPFWNLWIPRTFYESMGLRTPTTTWHVWSPVTPAVTSWPWRWKTPSSTSATASFPSWDELFGENQDFFWGEAGNLFFYLGRPLRFLHHSPGTKHLCCLNLLQ